MAIENPIHMNECGLPLNAIEWLETHHRSKLVERKCMVQDLHLQQGSRIVDAGCGPGLWTSLLARAIGSSGLITGVDVSEEALITARQRSVGQRYASQIFYKQGDLEQLPVGLSSIHTIFSANVSQYLSAPIQTFAALGRYLVPGGQLAIKDIDFGTIRFYTVDPALQARVFQAREAWEKQRILLEYTFEDSWVGSKLASYLRAAGYENVQEKSYTIFRRAPLAPDFRKYLQGIAQWFVCEDAPFLSSKDRELWMRYFVDGEECVLDQMAFCYEETEFMVTGTWPEHSQVHTFEMPMAMLESEHTHQ